jgi:hypothetical protein
LKDRAGALALDGRRDPFGGRDLRRDEPGFNLVFSTAGIFHPNVTVRWMTISHLLLVFDFMGHLMKTFRCYTSEDLKTQPRSALRRLGSSILAAVGATLLVCSSMYGQLASIYPIDLSNPSFEEGHGNGMVGWVFTVQTPLTISAVGWYDDGGDGLSRNFQVGLWQDLNDYFDPGSPAVHQLLGNAKVGISIPRGSAAPLINSYRVVNLSSPLTLQPGYYELAGLDSTTTSDPILYNFLGYAPPPINGIVNDGFFYAAIAPANSFGVTYSSDFYLAWGTESGPMLFTQIPEPPYHGLLIGFCAVAFLWLQKRQIKNVFG